MKRKNKYMLQGFFVCLCFFSFAKFFAANVGLCIMATGKYITLAKNLINSGRKYFCKNHHVTFFIFTDKILEPTADTIVIYQKKLGWPYDSLMRFEIYYRNWQYLQTMDYLFACDADMFFVSHIGDEILEKRVATQHPGFHVKKIRGTYDLNPRSKAYVMNTEGEQYFAGGFYGGIRDEFYQIIKTCSQNIKIDLEINYIALWHDESHLNRYFIDFKPTLTLSPSYCYPEGWNLEHEKKIIALEKNHAEMRKN